MTRIRGCPFIACEFNIKGLCIAEDIELAEPETVYYNDNDNEVEIDVEDVIVCKTFKRK